jgi:hypothetical protein
VGGHSIPVGYNWIMANVDHDGDECLLWPFKVSTPGYGQFNYQYVHYLAHRYMCRLVHGEPPMPSHHAAHSCGNRRCCNPRHLSWKSPRDNQLDRKKHGTTVKAQSKITLMQANQIKALKGIEGSVSIAARYGITESNVRLIHEGKIWKEVRKIARPLTADQVRTIRQIGNTKTARAIAAMLGVSTTSVFRVRQGRTHKIVI